MTTTREVAEAFEAKTAKEPTIPISEIFGPTIQGEGALAGRPTYFLRVGGCDYKCVWCDTADAVLAERVKLLPRLTQTEVSNRLLDWADTHPGPQWLTISGGNPGMYDLSQVVREWQMVGNVRTGIGSRFFPGKVAVETQGSRWQPWFVDVDLLTISPKPPSSEMPARGDSLTNLRSFMTLLAGSRYETSGYQRNEVLKVIVFDDTDYQFAQGVHKTYPNVPFYLSTGTAMGGLSGRWVPPVIPGLTGEPEDPDVFRFRREHQELGSNLQWANPAVDSKINLLRRYRWLVEKAAADPDMADVAIFPQLHVLLWGMTTKGV